MTSGFRTFTAGEVLTASNVQNYLMDQSVMTFAGSAARSSAIGTANFEEGMTSYLKDTDKLEVYNGTNWVGVAPTTTQGLTLINTTSFSGVASQSFNSIFNSTYDNYKIILDLTAVSGDLVLYMRMRASGTDASGIDYSLGYNYRSRAGASSGYNNNDATFWGILQGSSSELNHNYLVSLDMNSPALAIRTLFAANGYTAQGTDDVMYGFAGGGMHAANTAYDGFSLITSTGTVSGKVSIYGYNK